MRQQFVRWLARARAINAGFSVHPVRRVAIPAFAALCVVSLIWPKIQGIAIILLLYVTFEYLIAARETLDLLRDQLQKKENVFLHSDLICRDKSLRLRVSNLGRSNCLLESMHVRKQDEATFDFDVQRVVESGKTQEITVPDSTYRDEAFSVDLEFTLTYLALTGEGKTLPRVFNVSMAMNNTPRQVLEQISGVWRVRCPRCRIAVQMKTFGLQSFDEAYVRKQSLLESLRDSCPEHLSEWLLTLEDVQAQRLERLSRLEASGSRLDDISGEPQ